MKLIKVNDDTADQLEAQGRGEVQAEHYHLCQNGDGSPATVVIVNLDDSSTEILCTACNLALWTAVLTQLAGVDTTPSVDGQPAGV